METETIINWFVENWIENVGVATGLAYIILSVRQNIWCWFFGIISSGLYLFVFFDSKIYADMLLQLYYVAMGLYGWIHWARLDSHTSKKDLPITRLSARYTLNLVIINFVLFIVIAQLLIHFTDSPVPWIDAFTTSLSFIATWMLARKILEHWLVWIIVDSISVGLYFYRGLYSSIILFAVLTILAIVGFYQWKRQWNKTHLF
ncbi:MAG: nicotinamide mononucleotide transporter [Salinivirgaceae bacterium]|nr:nicotinamide mononucleotide transporter [Salinivirgaceae bacterium]